MCLKLEFSNDGLRNKKSVLSLTCNWKELFHAEMIRFNHENKARRELIHLGRIGVPKLVGEALRFPFSKLTSSVLREE